MFIALCIIDIIMFTLGYITEDFGLLYGTTLFLYLLLMVYLSKNMNSKIVFWCFGITFGIFMFGRIIIRPILGVEFLWDRFTDGETMHTFLCLFLALLALFVGNYFSKFKYIIGGKDRKIIVYRLQYVVDSSFEPYLRIVTKVLMYATIPFKIAEIAFTILFIQSTTYSSQYLVGGGFVPSWVDAMSRAHTFLFVLFLALYPEKKETKKACYLEMTVLAFAMIGGNRLEFICTMILIYVYFMFRNNTCVKDGISENWINKRLIVIAIVGMIALTVILQIVGISRGNASVSVTDNYILGFFDSMGYSIEIIPLGYRHQGDFFGSKIMYFWEPLFRHFKSLLGVGTYYTGQTVENAVYGYNFGGTLTYLESSYLYTVLGGGLGSSYIAELYHAFGYMGIVVFNIILGFILNRLSIKESYNWTKRFFILFVILGMMKLPRFNCWVWVLDLISKINILMFIVVIVIATMLKKRLNVNKS